MKKDQTSQKPGGGFGHSLPSKVVSCVASAVLATMMVPAVALADGDSAGSGNEGADSGLVKDLDGNGKIDVLLVGNSHAVDMTQYADVVAADAKTAGIGAGKVEITALTPMGGRRLYTDDTGRGSHIAAATMDESKYSQTHTETDSKGNPLAQNKKKYDDALNASNKTYDLVVLQDWHESTNDSDASKAAAGVAKAVKWIKGSNYNTIKGGTKVAWAADWPDAANHESYQGNMAGAYNAVQGLTENKPDFIVPVGTAVENSRSSYFGSVKNAKDAFPVQSENTAGLREPASKYDITARDANHLSYELGCYTASATLVGSVLKAEGVETSKITEALKTAPVTAENGQGGNAKDVSHEWKGEFTDSTWDVVKESIGNALDTPGNVTQSKYTEDPGDSYGGEILETDFSTVEAAAAKATSQAELEKAAEGALGCIDPAIVSKLGLTTANVECDFSVPIDGNADNPTGTSGNYKIAVRFLYGYSQQRLVVASGKIKPQYADGAEAQLNTKVAEVKANIEKYAKAFGYTDSIQELEDECLGDCYTVVDLDEALDDAIYEINDAVGVEAGGYITDNGWDELGNPVGNWTGIYWKFQNDELEFFGSGIMPAYDAFADKNGHPTLSNARVEWKKDGWLGEAKKVIIGSGISMGSLSVFLTGGENVREIIIKDGASLQSNAIYFNTLGNNLNVKFEGASTVTSKGIAWNDAQKYIGSRVYVYADSSKICRDQVGTAWGMNPFDGTTQNSEGYPILTFVEQGEPSSDGKSILLEKASLTNGGWDEQGNAIGDATGIFYEVYVEDGETVLEFSGEGEMPAYTNSKTVGEKDNPLFIQDAPWMKSNIKASVTKIKAGGNISYATLSLWAFTKAKEIAFGDNVKLARATVHYNAGMSQNVKITFEGKVCAENVAISMDYKDSYKDSASNPFKGQFTIVMDSSKIRNYNDTAAVTPESIVSSDISKTNVNGNCIGTIIDTYEASEVTEEEGTIWSGGWGEDKKPITDNGSVDSGVRYKIATDSKGEKTLEFYKDPNNQGLVKLPDYWATDSGDAGLKTDRIPWLKSKTKYKKIIVGPDVHIGKMALYVGSATPSEIIIKDGASLAQNAIYFNSIGNVTPQIIFEGNAQVSSYCISSWGMDAAATVDVYADLSKLTMGNGAVSSISDFAKPGDGNGTFNLHSNDNSVVGAMKKVESWNGEVNARDLCADNATDDMLASGVKAAVEQQIGENSGITVFVKKIVKGYYEITLSKDVDGTTPSKTTKKQVTFEHNWGYAQLAGSAYGFKETCKNCGQSTSVELVPSDSGAVRDGDQVKFTYNGKAKGFRIIYSGKLSTGNDLEITYKDAQGKDLASAPIVSGSYKACVAYGSSTLEVPFAIEQSADLSVTAEDYMETYDGKEHAVALVVKGGDNANEVTYSIDGGSTWSSVAPSIKDAGEKTVTVKVENPNFKTASCACELKVYKRNIDVTVENKTMTAGDKLPEFTYKTEGFVDGEGFASVAGAKAPTLSCKADGKTAGTFDITASDANAGGNYDITYVPAKLTVKAAPVTPSRPSNPDPTPTPNPTPAAPSVGDTVTSGEGATAANFKVTAVAEASGMGGEVEYAGPASAAGASNVTVPENVSINGVAYVVTSIAPEAFKGATDLVSIEIPATVVKVGASAFEGCTKLTAVKLPVGVKTIEARTFKGCAALKSVTTKAARIEASAFAGCSKLAKVKAPNVKVISKNAFKGAKNLKSLTTGASLTTIGASAFSGNKRLTSITVLSKYLSKASVKGSLKGSAVKTVVVKVGSKKANKSYAKKYAKLFTKKIAGKKATVTASKKPLKK